MTNVLIIEDQTSHYFDIKNEFEMFPEYFDVYPKQNNDTRHDLNNQGYLLDTLLKESDNEFENILKYYTNIDLFIIDATLYPANDDRIGITFLNYLKRKNYRNCKFNFIVLSQHNLENIGDILADFNPDFQYVSKNKWGNKFPKEVVNQSIKLLNLKLSDKVHLSKNESFFEKKWWILLPDFIDKQVIHRFNLFIFYVLILSTGLFAISGIFVDTICQFKHLVALISLEKNELNATELLEYVEHIFLYLLPLFIVFSFLSYYKLTIEIKLTGGNSRNIDHDGAMKSLNNSKYILLSSLLSFTIIKIIEKIFEEGITDKILLAAYIAFMIILMSFIIIQHKEAKIYNNKDK